MEFCEKKRKVLLEINIGYYSSYNRICAKDQETNNIIAERKFEDITFLYNLRLWFHKKLLFLTLKILGYKKENFSEEFIRK